MRKITSNRSLAARTAVAATTLALTAALSGTAFADPGDDHRGDHGDVLVLETGPSSQFQNPAGPVKAGTLVGGTGKLTRIDGDHEEDYGSDRWHCLYLEVAPNNARTVMQCNATFETPEGEIALQGAYTEHGRPLRTFEDAVTGGTGKYKNATGYAKYELLDPQDPNAGYHVTLYLGKGKDNDKGPR